MGCRQEALNAAKALAEVAGRGPITDLSSTTAIILEHISAPDMKERDALLEQVRALTTQLEESMAACKKQRAQLAEAKIACPCDALKGDDDG